MPPRIAHDRAQREKQWFRAAWLNQPDLLQKLLAARVGIDVLVKDEQLNRFELGETALGVATRRSNLDAVRFLIGAGAQVDRSDRKGLTPLMYAALNGNVAAAAMLLQAGANPSLSNIDGVTAVAMATNVAAAKPEDLSELIAVIRDAMLLQAVPEAVQGGAGATGALKSSGASVCAHAGDGADTDADERGSTDRVGGREVEVVGTVTNVQCVRST